MAAGALIRATRRPLVLAAAVLAGMLAGCQSESAGRGSPEALPTSAAPATSQLPVPDDSEIPTGTPPGGSGPTATTSTAAPRTTVPSTTTPPGGARPCPSAVAARLPAGRGAVLEAGYETSRFRLYYCRTADGRLFYHGVSKADSTQVVTLPATAIPGGYEARTTADGSSYLYRVAGGTLTVVRDGAVIRRDPVIGAL